MEVNEFLDQGFEEKTIKLVAASKGKRFANFIIDRIVIFVLSMVFFATFGILGLGAEWMASLNPVLDAILGMFLYAIFILLIEAGLGGKTIGKFITKTRTVTIEGYKPSFDAFLTRSFSRIVPFEPFSFLGSELSGWHDRWSDTMVIDEAESVWHYENDYE